MFHSPPRLMRPLLILCLLFIAGSNAMAQDKAKKPHVVMIACEDEYDAKTTLPQFAKAFNKDENFRITLLTGNEKKTDIPGLDAMDSADLIVLYLRRTTLPEPQLAKFKAWCEAGKPIVAIRTTSHGFQNWLEFDRTVLGATYGNHYGQKTKGTQISFVEKQAGHMILKGLDQKTFQSPMWLYKYANLAASVNVVMNGTFEDHVEPVTWTNIHNGGRVFYTSLGHADDFKSELFVKLLGNGIVWCLSKE